MVFVSNHPFGVVDGLSIGSIVEKARQGALIARLEAAAQDGLPDRPVSDLLEPGSRWNARLNAFSGAYNGAPFDDIDGAMARALRRLESFEADSTRVGRNAVRACFTFNLLDLQRLREDELPAYLKSVPFFDHVNVTMLGFSDEDFASWLLGELLRSKSIELKDGWILPTMAP